MRDYTRDAAEKIIGEAAKSDAEARERLTQAEIEDAAADVGIGRDAVRSVIAKETETTTRNAARRASVTKVIIAAVYSIIAAVLVVVVCDVIGSGIASSRVAAAHSRVEAERHKVTLAMDNRALVSYSLGTAINDGERATVIERAERRILVAKRDYNAAVTTYNSTTTGWFGSRARRAARLPAAEPYADEVWR